MSSPSLTNQPKWKSKNLVTLWTIWRPSRFTRRCVAQYHRWKTKGVVDTLDDTVARAGKEPLGYSGQFEERGNVGVGD